MFGIDDAIMGAIIGSMGTVAGSAVARGGMSGGSDLKPRQHRELWTERLRFNQASKGARNNLADYEQWRSNHRQGLLRRFNRSQALLDAGTSRNIRGQDFTQTLGLNNAAFRQQRNFSASTFRQQQNFEGTRLNTETAGRAGQRGIAQRQQLQAMFPEASPWDLMGTGHQASAGQAVFPGYPSAQSANNAAGPSPSQQLRASEMASASKLAAMLLPTPAVQAAQTTARANMYSFTVHAMSGLAQAMISAKAPGKMANIAANKAPTEIDFMRKKGALATVQSGTEAGKQNIQEQELKNLVGKQNIQEQELENLRSKNKYADKFYKGQSDYESQRTTLGYGQLGVSGLGVVQANRMLNKFGRSLFGQSDKLTKKLSGARSIKSSASKYPSPNYPRHSSKPRWWRDDSAIPRSSETGMTLW